MATCVFGFAQAMRAARRGNVGYIYLLLHFFFSFSILVRLVVVIPFHLFGRYLFIIRMSAGVLALRAPAPNTHYSADALTIVYEILFLHVLNRIMVFGFFFRVHGWVWVMAISEKDPFR